MAWFATCEETEEKAGADRGGWRQRSQAACAATRAGGLVRRAGFVPRPVGFFTDLGDAGIKMRMLIVGTHALNEAVQFRILRLGGIQ